MVAGLILATSQIIAEPAVAPPVDEQVKRKLICEAETISPGLTFTVALHLDHVAPFHTYWRNPGLVGMPTQLKWTLPDGFEAGPIQWPPPARSKMLIYNTHGLEGEVFLLVDVTAPQELKAKSVVLKVESILMSCSAKVCCSMARDQFELRLPVGEEVRWNEDARAKIAKAREAIPQPVDGWTSAVRLEKDVLHLRLEKEAGDVSTRSNVYFFPDQNVSNTEAEQKATLSDGGLDLEIPVAEYWDRKDRQLSGVIFSDQGWDDQGTRFMRISMNLEHNPEDKESEGRKP